MSENMGVHPALIMSSNQRPCNPGSTEFHSNPNVPFTIISTKNKCTIQHNDKIPSFSIQNNHKIPSFNNPHSTFKMIIKHPLFNTHISKLKTQQSKLNTQHSTLTFQDSKLKTHISTPNAQHSHFNTHISKLNTHISKLNTHISILNTHHSKLKA